MPLEHFARSLFGDKYFGSVNWTGITEWKSFYSSCVEVIEQSIYKSIGSIDPSHREQISNVLQTLRLRLKDANGKDQIHAILIVGLFKLVFLLLGRLPYVVRGRRRSFGTFRTLTYSQTEEQLSWLLQGAIQSSAREHGFVDSFDADVAFIRWAKEKKRMQSDRIAYVEWVRENFPETYRKFR